MSRWSLLQKAGANNKSGYDEILFRVPAKDYQTVDLPFDDDLRSDAEEKYIDPEWALPEGEKVKGRTWALIDRTGAFKKAEHEDTHGPATISIKEQTRYVVGRKID
eukprot:CAMPEP_0182598614 /NCGR_PEP_ID=MMETSP1324-20130603/88636_1 /TAXON_ID=236786 /ORGANISM="Florenciella sp., Strain RCC1587" /LENGTH=105 /DNA_ID=CAMNT_0024816459 /DNA_START=9 /DNA_END=323 /DNA_ORIENTATION=+